MNKFITTNGIIFRSIGGINQFRSLEYNREIDSWSPHASEPDMLAYMDKMNEFTKNPQQHIFQLLSYSTVVSHSFY
jgi:hypothetical protein